MSDPRRGHSHTIDFMVGSIIEPVFAQLTRTITKAVHARGYVLIVANNEYNSTLELEHLRMFRGQCVSGLTIRSTFGGGNLEYVQRLHQSGMNILEIDHFLHGSPFGHIMIDLGHRRIATLDVYDAKRLQDK